MANIDQIASDEERITKNREELGDLLLVGENDEYSERIDPIIEVLAHLPNELVGQIRYQHRIGVDASLYFGLPTVRKYGLIIGWTEDGKFNPVGEYFVCAHLDFLWGIVENIERLRSRREEDIVVTDIVEHALDDEMIPGGTSKVTKYIEQLKDASLWMARRFIRNDNFTTESSVVDATYVKDAIVSAICQSYGLDINDSNKVASLLTAKAYRLEDALRDIRSGIQAAEIAITLRLDPEIVDSAN